MDLRTRFDNLNEAVTALIEAKLAELHTAIPFKIVSVDHAKQTAVVQPTIKALIKKPDGSQEWISLPQVPDVPLHFPSGGGTTMTFPVKEGDEGLMVISSRSQDVWQQSGGEQQQIDLRTHDLSNGFALVGFKSNPKALENVSPDSVQLRSDDGKHVVDLNPSSGITLSSEGQSLAISKSGWAFKGDGKITHNGKNIGDSHVHGGVVPGGSDTDVPSN